MTPINVHRFHLPTRPVTLIQAINRCAAATGSIGYASATADADYNGHHVIVSWNDYRRYYVAEHTWAGRVVHARGDLNRCLRAAIAEYDRGAAGASVAVALRPGDTHTDIDSTLLARLVPGEEPHRAGPWYSGCVEECLRRHATHHLIAVDALDLDDQGKRDELWARVFPRRNAVVWRREEADE